MARRTKLTPPPAPISRFDEALRALAPRASLAVDRPDDPKGEWWLDVSSGRFRSSLAWRPSEGFGVFASASSYGQRPDEIYRSPELAAKRVGQLIGQSLAGSQPSPLSLSDIRRLLETSQTSLAESLDVNQAAVSRLERRGDVKLSSLDAYVRAMGGRVELRVRFDEFDALVAVTPAESEETDDGKS